MQREKNLQRRSETRSTIYLRRYEAMSANKHSKETSVKSFNDAKSTENMRRQASMEK